MQALVGPMAENEVDNAPGVIGLFRAFSRVAARVVAGVHGPSTRRPDRPRHLILRQRFGKFLPCACHGKHVPSLLQLRTLLDIGPSSRYSPERDRGLWCRRGGHIPD